MTHAELKAAVKQAMKNKEAVKLSVLRGLMAAAVNEAVAKKRKPDEELSEDELMAVVSRAARQRKDSVEQFEKGGRSDLASKEREELAIIEALLPAQMNEEEIRAAAKAKAAELDITDKSSSNKLIGMLMKDLKGRADGTMVKRIVDGLFA